MEQKKKNEKDVLVVRDEKTGEISVVAGLDSKGYPKTAPAKVLPVIKDLLKDPAANAEMLAAHKVDTSEYQRQATETLAGGQTPETEEAKRENAETEAVEQLAAEETKKENTDENSVQRKKRILTKIVYNKKQMRQWKN